MSPEDQQATDTESPDEDVVPHIFRRLKEILRKPPSSLAMQEPWQREHREGTWEQAPTTASAGNAIDKVRDDIDGVQEVNYSSHL